MNPHQNPNHIRYVEDGGCPVIHFSKAWCNLEVGHEGKHYSPGTVHSNSETGLFWSDEEGRNYPKGI